MFLYIKNTILISLGPVLSIIKHYINELITLFKKYEWSIKYSKYTLNIILLIYNK